MSIISNIKNNWYASASYIKHDKSFSSDRKLNIISIDSDDEIDINEIDENIEHNKKYIIAKFNNCVRNKLINLENKNIKHCGKEGHWLETQFGIKHNSKNEPDINGFEMKKSANKTTLGDFSATEYAFSNERYYINNYNNWTDDVKITRQEFIHYFGNPNIKKYNRYSWSGRACPLYNIYNNNGQILEIVENNDIVIYYSFLQDTRSDKNNILPTFLQTKDKKVIAIWKHDKLQKNINNKFNKNGFFICKKIKNIYKTICFGKPFNFEYFITCIKNNKIIFDSGMYDGNNRNYSQFKGNKNFWNELIYEEY
jgi:hypothetical protein